MAAEKKPQKKAQKVEKESPGSITPSRKMEMRGDIPVWVEVKKE